MYNDLRQAFDLFCKLMPAARAVRAQQTGTQGSLAMNVRLFSASLRAAAAAALVCSVNLAQAQSAPAGAPEAQPGAAAAPAVQPGASAAPRRAVKRRGARADAGMGCEKVNDPWGDLCQIRKNAEAACSDLSPPAKAKTARKSRKAAPAPAAAAPDQRRECVDAYMRNV
ncbi:MAG: hypothetical protein JNM90_00985 [Burkholderiales bacterium]|nr:hypothetical protein [Burkholderiales bacterium]